ncbi:hypothetical protein DFS34DRAFT_516602 [Phlyctochytrium arcticum]|nr:hypothetical protein DFS34DRAFT_516602 [Phlyctochytrium arcticum]
MSNGQNPDADIHSYTQAPPDSGFSHLPSVDESRIRTSLKDRFTFNKKKPSKQSTAPRSVLPAPDAQQIHTPIDNFGGQQDAVCPTTPHIASGSDFFSDDISLMSRTITPFAPSITTESRRSETPHSVHNAPSVYSDTTAANSASYRPRSAHAQHERAKPTRPHFTVPSTPRHSESPSIDHAATPELHAGPPMPGTPFEASPSMENKIVCYLQEHHINDLRKSILEAMLVQSERHSLKPRYTVSVKLDAALLLDYDAEIGNQILESVNEKAKAKFAEACFHLINMLTNGAGVLPEHVRCNITLLYYPGIARIVQFSDIYKIFRGETAYTVSGKLLPISGKISRMHLPYHFTFSTYHVCLNPKCRNRNSIQITMGGSGTNIIKRDSHDKALGVSSSVAFHEIDLSCSYCGENMTEAPTDRVTTVRQWGELSSLRPEGCFSNTVHFCLEDTLVGTHEVGDIVELIGTITPQIGNASGSRFHGQYGLLMQVNNVKRLNMTTGAHPHTLSIHKPDLFGRGHAPIPDSVAQLLRSGMSPFAYTQALVDNFCAMIAPYDVWRKCRLAMLLSLVSVPSDTDHQTLKTGGEGSKENSLRDSVNICILTDAYTPALRRLMNAGAGHRKSAYWEHGTSKVRQKLFHTNENQKTGDSSLDGGLLGDARNGILQVSLNTLTKNDIQTTCSLVDSTVIRVSEKGDQSFNIHPNFAMWATGKIKPSPAAGKKGHSAAVTLQEMLSETLYTSPLMSKIDIVINMKTASDPTIDATLSEHILAGELGLLKAQRDHPWFISEADFAQYIQIACNITVKISDECQVILRSYFSAFRRIVGNAPGAHSNFAKMETLARLAASHARVCDTLHS